jgi:MFS family permease
VAEANSPQLSLFIAAIDQTILATAIPTISSQLHSATGYTWIGGAYLLASAGAGPIWAALSDIWGRKPIILAAVGVFFASSILCSLSNTMKMLIIGRAFQGVAGGGLIPLCMITISDLFSVRWVDSDVGFLFLLNVLIWGAEKEASILGSPSSCGQWLAA